VARLVVDLEKKTPYSIRPSANAITVVFDASSGAVSGSVPRRENEGTNLAIPDQGKPAPRTQTPAPAAAPLPRLQSPEPQPSRAPASPRPATIEAEQPATVPSEERKGATRPAESAASAANQAPSVEPKTGLGWLPPNEDYVIGPQDVLAINVWRETEISRVVPVRPDGKISLPLIGEMTASGLTPGKLQSRISEALEAYIHKPQVTVIVQEANSHKFYIIGEVERPGVYALATNMTVIDALAAAGGFREFARVKEIYLLRRMPDGSRKPIPFNFKAAVDGRNPYRDLELRPGDTIVVP